MLDKRGSITVLIIDDEEAIREYVRMFLEKRGYRVLEADNGKTALRQLTYVHVDIIITDLVMPEKEGMETIKEIKSLYPNSSIIAMSGSVFGPSYLPMAKMLGAESVLQKPFHKQALLDAIDSIVTKKNGASDSEGNII